jgi:hypothetical protein
LTAIHFENKRALFRRAPRRLPNSFADVGSTQVAPNNGPHCALLNTNVEFINALQLKLFVDVPEAPPKARRALAFLIDATKLKCHGAQPNTPQTQTTA